MKNKRGLEMSFAWIFALIVGAVILFLAIYAVTKIIGTEQQISDVEIAEEIGALLNPLETGFESGKTTTLILPAETRIYNECSEIGNFGEQRIKISQKNFGKWTETNTGTEFSNKYIFSGGNSEGKKFFLFSKSFEFPFKVADLIYLSSSSEEYCFVEPPERIEEELKEINQKNLLLNCSEKSVKVCFDEVDDCDVTVNEDGEYVEKNREKVYFKGEALMYAAIFADKEIYECQVKRLVKRLENLAELYRGKENFISGICEANLGSDLASIKELASELKSSEGLYLISALVEDAEEKNEAGGCELW